MSFPVENMEKIDTTEKVWEQTPQTIEPIYRIDEKPNSIAESILYGWQHTLVDISPFVLPLMIAAHMGMSAMEGAQFVNCCLFAMGVATIIQTTIGNRLPIIQGPSATHTAVLSHAANLFHPITIWFAILLGGIFEMIVGLTGVLKHLRKFFPIAVSGCVVICIGLSLGRVAILWTIGDGNTTNILLAVLVMFCIFSLQIFAKNIWGGLISRASVFISIWFVGLGVASFLGCVDWNLVAEKQWLALPYFSILDVSQFRWDSMLMGAFFVIIAGYIGSILESIGDYAATCAAAKEDYTVKHMNNGIAAEGFACCLSAFIGAIPCTSYSQNIGIISTTRIASRFVVQIAAIILILYGLCPKLGALLVAMPRSVLGAVFVIVCGMISMSGIRLLSAAPNTNENAIVIGTTLICAITIPNFMSNKNWDLPMFLDILTRNTVVIAVVLGVLLNAFFNIKGNKTDNV